METSLIIQIAAIILSAIGVIITIIWRQKISKRKSTLDIILAEETDTKLVKQRTEFVKIRNSRGISNFAAKDKAESNEAEIIRAVLNFNELIAIGIAEKTIDQRIYKRWGRTKFVKDWTGCKPFVMELRNQTETTTYFCEIENLARKWANKDEKPMV